MVKALIATSILVQAAAWACIGEAPVVAIADHIEIAARAQSGIRIEGRNEKPTVTSSRQLSGPAIGLKATTEVTQIRDVRPVWKRMLGGSPDLRDVPIPRQIEIRPERTPEQELSYELKLKEGSREFEVRIRFEGGMQRGGCGGDAKVTRY